MAKVREFAQGDRGNIYAQGEREKGRDGGREREKGRVTEMRTH